MSWADRAKARFSENCPVGTDETAKTPLSSVSSLRTQHFQENTPGVSSVSSVGGGGLSKNAAANETLPEDYLLVELITASMLACIHHGDGPEAREAMREDCLATPPHLRADLLAHFQQTYGGRA